VTVCASPNLTLVGDRIDIEMAQSQIEFFDSSEGVTKGSPW
jgi:hypothetical protein